MYSCYLGALRPCECNCLVLINDLQIKKKKFPALPWEFFLEGKDSHGDHGLGSLVEFRLRPLQYFIFIYHLTPHQPHGLPTSEVG
jgi:hypothetical protein